MPSLNIGGRESIVSEIGSAPEDLKAYLVAVVQTLFKSRDFREALPGHFPPDGASQQRLPQLLKKLNAIAAL